MFDRVFDVVYDRIFDWVQLGIHLNVRSISIRWEYVSCRSWERIFYERISRRYTKKYFFDVIERRIAQIDILSAQKNNLNQLWKEITKNVVVYLNPFRAEFFPQKHMNEVSFIVEAILNLKWLYYPIEQIKLPDAYGKSPLNSIIMHCNDIQNLFFLQAQCNWFSHADVKQHNRHMHPLNFLLCARCCCSFVHSGAEQ